MKTQLTHFQRQMLHSHELMVHRVKKENARQEGKALVAGWVVLGVFGVITLISYLLG